MRMGVKSVALVVSVTLSLVSSLHCLSLEQIHSSSPAFKSLSHNRDKTSQTAFESIRNRRRDVSRPAIDLEFYKRLMSPRPDYEPTDALLMLNRREAEEQNENDLLSTELGLRLAQIIDSNPRVFDTINRKKKRSASNRNYYTQTSEAKSTKVKKPKAVVMSGDHRLRSVSAGKHKPSVKSVVKRKSGRRVLEEHFHLEKSQPDVMSKAIHQNKITFPVIESISKLKLSRNIGNKMKKSIKIRRDANPLETSLKSNPNETNEMKNELKTDKTVVTELKDILSDDSKSSGKLISKVNETLQRKEQNKSKDKGNKEVMEAIKDHQIGYLAKRKTKRSDSAEETVLSDDIDDSDSAIVYQSSDRTDKNQSPDSEKWTNDEMNEWLRREFYENIAKTLATMRKKRSDDNEDFDGLGESELDKDNLIAIDESDEDNDFESDRLSQRVADESDNDYVITTVDDAKDMTSPDSGDDERLQGDSDMDDNPDNDIPNATEGGEDDDGDFDWQQLEEKSSAKTKRSVDSYFGDLEDNDETNDVNIKSDRFDRINTALESIEDSLINEAMDLIGDMAAEGSQSEAQTSKRVANRLDAAYDIEDMRTALQDLTNNFNKLKKENNGLEEYRSDRQSKQKSRALFEKKSSNFLEDNSIDTDLEADSGSDVRSQCSALSQLSTDCSSVADLVPSARVRSAFVESCNWHQICYTCGEIYGLMATDCDAGFLEASRLSCGESPSCEAFARLVLSPLRQSRVFYKTSVAQTCYQYQCIKEVLLDSKR